MQETWTGNGDLDLATASRSSANVSVLKNNGNGIFAAAQNFAVEDRPESITVGDLDGDCDLDLITADSNSFVTVLQSTTPTLQLSPSPNREGKY